MQKKIVDFPLLLITPHTGYHEKKKKKWLEKQVVSCLSNTLKEISLEYDGNDDVEERKKERFDCNFHFLPLFVKAKHVISVYW